jgi:hypothetical protein
MTRQRELNGLYRHPTGIWYWRRVDPKTGRRVHRSTGTRRKDLALRKAATFDDEWEKAAAGLPSFDWARVALDPLVPDWIADMGHVTESTRKIRRSLLLRAFGDLRLRVIADLSDVGALDRRLRALGKPHATLQRGYQAPLKLFARWLAENHRYTERNLLATWKKLETRTTEEARRALLPEEVARAFLAADRLDAFHGRRHPTRPVLLALLVTAPRATALCTRDVEDLLADRLDYGDGRGNKRNGWGALDAVTAADLRAYVGSRKKGPLFLSPTGGRFDRLRLLDIWREAFGLGVLDELLPDATLEDRILANRALLHGRVQVSKGGSRLKSTTLARLSERERAVAGLIERVRAEWTQRLTGVDVHAFRKTHQTWAEAQGVPTVLIDKQLGHAVAGGSQLDVFRAVRALGASRVGRKHYLDLGSKLLDPMPAAEAIRGLLDDALRVLTTDAEAVLSG